MYDFMSSIINKSVSRFTVKLYWFRVEMEIWRRKRQLCPGIRKGNSVPIRAIKYHAHTRTHANTRTH